MAIGLSLFTGISWHFMFLVAALLVWVTTWRAPFSFIENAPALLGLVTLSFVVAVFALGGAPKPLLPTLWQPAIKQGELADYLYLAAAILGAIISPYLLYFYSSGAREEKWTRDSLLPNRVTAIVGMSFGSLSAIALIFLAAIVLQPLNINASTLGEVGIIMARPFGVIGAFLFAAGLLVCCFEQHLRSCFRSHTISPRASAGNGARRRNPICIQDLLGSKIVTSEGKKIGRVVDLQIGPGPEPAVIALVYGKYGWLYRWHVLYPFAEKVGLRSEPDIVPWDAVESFEHLTVQLKPGREPQRK